MGSGKQLHVSDEHLESIAADILGGILGGTGNALDLTQLQPFVDQALKLAEQLIVTNRNR